MSKMTKSQLVDENTRLREHCAHLESRLEALRTQPIVPGRRPGDIVGAYTKADGSRWVKVVVSDKVVAHRPAH